MTITTERRCKAQTGVGGTVTTDAGGARLRRVVGSNWRRNAVGRRRGDRIGYRLLGSVLRPLAHTHIGSAPWMMKKAPIPGEHRIDSQPLRVYGASDRGYGDTIKARVL